MPSLSQKIALTALSLTLMGVSCDSGSGNRRYSNGYGSAGIYSNYGYGAGAVLQTAPQTSSGGAAYYNGSQFYSSGHFPSNACTPCNNGSYLRPSYQNFSGGAFNPFTNNSWRPPTHGQMHNGIGTYAGSNYMISQPFYNSNGCPIYMPSHPSCSGGIIQSPEHYRASQYLQGAGVAFYRGDVHAAQSYLAQAEGTLPEDADLQDDLIQSQEDLYELFGAPADVGAVGREIAEKNHPRKKHQRPDWRFLNRDLQEISEGLATSIEQMGFNMIHTPLHSIRRSISRIEDRMYLDSFAAYGWDSPEAYYASGYGNLGPVCCP